MRLKWADRMRVKCIFGWLMLAATSLHAGDTAVFIDVLTKPLNSPVKKFLHGEFGRFTFQSGSNVLPFSMVGRIATGGYIGSDVTERIENKLKGENRAGLFQQMSLVVYPFQSRFGSYWRTKMESGIGLKDAVTLQTISLRTTQTVGATFTDDAYRMAFRGNGYYRGRSLEVGENEFQLLGYNAVDFSFRTDVSQSKVFHVSLLQATAFSRFSTKDMTLFTSASGDSLSFNGRYINQGTGHRGWGEKGMGLSVGFDRMYTFRGLGGFKRSGNFPILAVGVRDLGFLYLPSVQVESRGYVWDASMKGLTEVGESPIQSIPLKQAVVNAKELQLSNWFGNQRDSAMSKLELKEQTRRGTVMIPFSVYADLLNMPIKDQQFGVNATYLHVPGYRVSTRIWWNKTLLPKGEQKWQSLLLQPYVAMGGFDTYDLGMSMQLNASIKRMGYVNFRLDARGLEAWAMSNRQHGAGLSAAMSLQL